MKKGLPRYEEKGSRMMKDLTCLTRKTTLWVVAMIVMLCIAGAAQAATQTDYYYNLASHNPNPKTWDHPERACGTPDDSYAMDRPGAPDPPDHGDLYTQTNPLTNPGWNYTTPSGWAIQDVYTAVRGYSDNGADVELLIYDYCGAHGDLCQRTGNLLFDSSLDWYLETLITPPTGGWTQAKVDDIRVRFHPTTGWGNYEDAFVDTFRLKVIHYKADTPTPVSYTHLRAHET